MPCLRKGLALASGRSDGSSLRNGLRLASSCSLHSTGSHTLHVENPTEGRLVLQKTAQTRGARFICTAHQCFQTFASARRARRAAPTRACGPSAHTATTPNPPVPSCPCPTCAIAEAAAFVSPAATAEAMASAVALAPPAGAGDPGGAAGELGGPAAGDEGGPSVFGGAAVLGGGVPPGLLAAGGPWSRRRCSGKEVLPSAVVEQAARAQAAQCLVGLEKEAKSVHTFLPGCSSPATQAATPGTGLLPAATAVPTHDRTGGMVGIMPAFCCVCPPPMRGGRRHSS